MTIIINIIVIYSQCDGKFSQMMGWLDLRGRGDAETAVKTNSKAILSLVAFYVRPDWRQAAARRRRTENEAMTRIRRASYVGRIQPQTKIAHNEIWIEGCGGGGGATINLGIH